MSKPGELRDYYDNTDLSENIEAAERLEPTVDEPMVTYALRLPKPVMDRMREVAEVRGVRVSALMRTWLEERLVQADDEDRCITFQARDLLGFIAERGAVSKLVVPEP